MKQKKIIINGRITANEKKSDLEFYVDAGWVFCKTLLWNNHDFNDAEIELAKQMIAIYLVKADNLKIKFIRFCERVQLAFQYINRKVGRYACHPLKWLNQFYEFGFYGTREWYLDLIHERKYIPIHRFELRVMAEAYVEYILNPSKEIYLIGKNAIEHYNKTDILQAFNNAVLNYNYNN